MASSTYDAGHYCFVCDRPGCLWNNIPAICHAVSWDVMWCHTLVSQCQAAYPQQIGLLLLHLPHQKYFICSITVSIIDNTGFTSSSVIQLLCPRMNCAVCWTFQLDIIYQIWPIFWLWVPRLAHTLPLTCLIEILAVWDCLISLPNISVKIQKNPKSCIQRLAFLDVIASLEPGLLVGWWMGWLGELVKNSIIRIYIDTV